MRGLIRLVGLIIVLNAVFVGVMVALKRAMPSMGDEDSDEISLVSILEGRELKSRAASFRGGSALNVTAGQVIDLRGATLAPGGAFLEVRTVMGGTAVAVPEDWPVEVRSQAYMGSVTNRIEDSPDDDRDGLTIDAVAVMGSIDIAHKPQFQVGAGEGWDSSEEQLAVAPTVV
jgi:hypothetical protein